MSVSDGQQGSAAVFNAAFVSATDADEKDGNLTLNDKLSLQDSGSATMTDAQLEINNLKDEFDTSTGHDHDGTDSKKVLATNLDTTGGSNGQVLKADGAGGASWQNGGGGFTASNDNRLIRSDTVGANELQESGITVDDSDVISGVDSLSLASGGTGTIVTPTITTPSTPASGLSTIYVDNTTDQLATVDDGGNVILYNKGAEYAVVTDQKTSGTNGGTFTTGDWRTRDLNTVQGTIASVTSNQIELGAGDYLIMWSAPAYRVAAHQTRLQNITDATTVEVGSIDIALHTSDFSSSRSMGSARFTIAGTKDFEIQHRCNVTRSSDGFGQAGSITTEQYTIVTIIKFG